ncbi:hypothetical protein KPATCC21470_4233 [Kitasatospora purpeofusca]
MPSRTSPPPAGMKAAASPGPPGPRRRADPRPPANRRPAGRARGHGRAHIDTGPEHGTPARRRETAGRPDPGGPDQLRGPPDARHRARDPAIRNAAS